MNIARVIKNRGRRNQQRRGMTFIEVLVSVVIFVICIPALVGAMLFCYGTLKINAHKLTAINLTQKKIENLMNLKYASLSTAAHAYDESNVPLDSVGALKGTVGVVVTADGANRKKIAVTTNWTEQRRNLRVALNTMISSNYFPNP